MQQAFGHIGMDGKGATPRKFMPLLHFKLHTLASSVAWIFLLISRQPGRGVCCHSHPAVNIHCKLQWFKYSCSALLLLQLILLQV